jgi:hypothetical protein
MAGVNGVDGSVDLDKYHKSAVSVAAFFKLFFMELPDTLLTKRLASTFLKTHSTHSCPLYPMKSVHR